MKSTYKKQALAYRISCETNTLYVEERPEYYHKERESLL